MVAVNHTVTQVVVADMGDRTVEAICKPLLGNCVELGVMDTVGPTGAYMAFVWEIRMRIDGYSVLYFVFS